MRKSLIIFIGLLFFLISCREEVEGWDSLTPEEQDEISNRAQRNCLSSNAASYEAFLVNSSDTFVSSSYERGDGYLHEFKLDSTLIHSVELRVWKQTTTAIYFYVTEIDEVGSTDSYFLRLDKDQNELIINQLKADQCAKTYSSVSISSGGPLVVKLEYEIPIGSDSKEYTDTYTFNFSKLAFFGTYHLVRKIVTRDSDDTETDSKTYSSSFNSKTYTSDFESSDYSDSSEYEQSFCELIPESGESEFKLVQEISGFNNKNCTSSAPEDWDLAL